MHTIHYNTYNILGMHETCLAYGGILNLYDILYAYTFSI